MINIYGDISNAMDNILNKYQKIKGISCGDISPEMYNEYCDRLNDMTMILEKILKEQER